MQSRGAAARSGGLKSTERADKEIKIKKDLLAVLFLNMLCILSGFGLLLSG